RHTRFSRDWSSDVCSSDLNNKTGFDVLSSISFNDFSLIFTTAFEQYAVDAFKFSAIDYLLKPIGREEFDCALRKAFERQKQNQLSERISVLLSHLSDVKIAKRISIPSKDGYNFIHIADIVRCEADINYTHIFTRDRKKFTVAKPLKYFEGLLVPYGFFRIHNSHLVNLDCVKSYAKSGYITLMDNMRLDVSLRRKEEFLKVCKGLLFKRYLLYKGILNHKFNKPKGNAKTLKSRTTSRPISNSIALSLPTKLDALQI